jgi:vacuolar-type H+-ATPase subunit F/Vma7
LLVVIDHAFAINYHILRFSKSEAQAEVHMIKEAIRTQKKDEISIVAIDHNLASSSHADIIFHNISSILAAQDLNLKVINGYSGSYPEGYGVF